MKGVVFSRINVVLSCIYPRGIREVCRTHPSYLVTSLFSDEQWYQNFRVTRACNIHILCYLNLFFLFLASCSFSPLAAMLERGQIVLRMIDDEHIFYFFRNLDTAPLARRAETTSWESLSTFNFSAPVPIFVTFTRRQKAEVPCLIFWARVPIFRGAVPKTLHGRVNRPILTVESTFSLHGSGVTLIG